MQRKRMQLTEMHSNPALIPAHACMRMVIRRRASRFPPARWEAAEAQKAGGIDRPVAQRGVNDGRGWAHWSPAAAWSSMG